jgi:vacuolar protein sorting-associated protein 13A/C
MQALIRGVGEGIVGFFQHPYQHGRKDGAAGILKGSTIGVAGVVIKPLTGVFDAASKTAEGLTNTATYFDDQPNTLRMRDIRAFYENSRYIKSFNEDDSYFLKYLNNQNILLIDTFRLFDIELKKSMYLIIT